MALPRRRRKCTRARNLAVLAAALVLAADPRPPGAATTERVVTGWHTGLAIDGFDPVAYFTDGKPVAGRPEFELPFAQVVWRFCNEGNRAAFAEAPEVYLPRYGGYDPVAVARGAATPGNPLIWLIADERLYLFHNPQAQAAFLADRRGITEAADARWPEVTRQLVP